MKRFFFLALFPLVAFAQNSNTAFWPVTKEYAFSATGSSGTPIQIAGGFQSCTQYRIVSVGTTGTTVTVSFGNSSTAVATVAQPIPGTPQQTVTYLAGTDEILTGNFSQAWVNAITSTGTITLYITCGIGV